MGWMVALTVLFALALQDQAGAVAQAKPKGVAAEALKLLISIEQQIITTPFPARVTLHFHNSGQEPFWLYRRVRSPEAASRSEARPADGSEGTTHYTTGGSTLEVRLLPMQASEMAKEAEGTVLESVGLPHPKLVKLNAGDDYEEKTVIRLAPAVAESKGENKIVWGRYRFGVVYRARYSNAEEAERNLGFQVWQGEVTSNPVELELRPSPASAPGSAAGTAMSPNGQPLADVVVSLSDEQERLVAQLVTNSEGRFSFTQLPLGLYWVTGRFANSHTDTAVFRHVELTPDQPAGAMELVMTPQEIYEPKGLLHKPVLFRVTDNAGRPLDRVTLEITWSSGTVMDKVKAQVSDDGAAAMELIPGRNFVTLNRRGCPKEEQRVDVAEGDGIDDFSLALECAGKK